MEGVSAGEFVKGEWTLNFVCKWWPVLTPVSLAELLMAHRRRVAHGPDPSRTVTLEIRRPHKIRTVIRVDGSDLRCVEETFKDRIYDPACLGRRLGTFIDLGANIGVASQYVAAHHPECSIFAVEPAPANARLLQINLQGLIVAGRCRVLEAAVWDKTDSSLLIRNPRGDYSSFQMEESRGDGGELIRGLTMDSIIQESGFREVDLLKVDVEGAEVQLFSGSPDWLRRVRMIAIEFHGQARQDSRFDEVMSHAGFKVAIENWHTVVASRNS